MVTEQVFNDVYFLIAITVSFNKPMIRVNENGGPAKLVLVLSNPSSTNITIIIINHDNSATGKHIKITY